MGNNHKIKIFKKIDWKWVLTGFCFFIVGHLLPWTLVRLSMRAYIYTSSIETEIDGGIVIITSMILLMIVGVYIGYRSKKVTILEPGLSSLLYMLLFSITAPVLWQGILQISSYYKILLIITAALLSAIIGAWIGEILQAKKLQKIVTETQE